MRNLTYYRRAGSASPTMYYTVTQYAKGPTNKKIELTNKTYSAVSQFFLKSKTQTVLGYWQNIKSNHKHKTKVRKLENSHLLGISCDVGLSVLKIGSTKCKDCPILVA